MPLLVEMGWGGTVKSTSSIAWTDITQRVDTVQGVDIDRGAADERSETQPGTATLMLDNADGALTPGNTSSPFYPFVRRNAPIRVSKAVIPSKSGASPYPLSQLGDDFDNGMPDPSLWTTGGGAAETEGRMRLPLGGGVSSFYRSVREWKLTGSRLAAKFSTVPAAGGSSSASVSMYIHSATSGTRVRWYYNALNGELRALNEVGSTDASPTVLTYSPISHAWLRIRESSGTLYFETSADGFGWTVRRSLPTPAWVGTDVEQVEFAAFRSGGVSDYAEFDLVGASIRPRFYGMVNEWPVEWEGLYSKVQISCTDLFKLLNRRPLLKSVLGEEILLDSPGVYYPLTEDSTATSAGDISGQSGGSALAIVQAGSGGTAEFGTETAPPATEDHALQLTPVSASAGKYLRADLSPTFIEAGANSQDLVIECWFTTSVQGRNLLTVYDTHDLSRIIVSLESGTGHLSVDSRDSGSSTTYVDGGANYADGKLHHLVIVTEAGRLYVDGVDLGSALIFRAFDYTRLVIGASHTGAGLWSGSISHVALYAGHSLANSEFTGHYTAGMTAYSGEAADDRIMRLARYAGLNSVTVWGTTHDAVAGQGPGGTSVVARMREIESTEAARLWAERDWFGLAYQSRDIRYNPSPGSETFTIDYADTETASFQLADDDQKLVNTVDATRPGGATQRVSDPASVAEFGEYPQDLNVLKTSDNSVLDAASWLVSRYADPSPELREVAIEAHTMASYLDILDAEIGSFFSVYNLPAQAPSPSMRVTVEGYTETIKHNSHVITFHTSASSTDSVWVLDDAAYSVLGTTTRLAY